MPQGFYNPIRRFQNSSIFFPKQDIGWIQKCFILRRIRKSLEFCLRKNLKKSCRPLIYLKDSERIPGASRVLFSNELERIMVIISERMWKNSGGILCVRIGNNLKESWWSLMSCFWKNIEDPFLLFFKKFNRISLRMLCFWRNLKESLEDLNVLVFFFF